MTFLLLLLLLFCICFFGGMTGHLIKCLRGSSLLQHRSVLPSYGFIIEHYMCNCILSLPLKKIPPQTVELKTREIFSHNCGVQKSKSRYQQGHTHFEDSREEFFPVLFLALMVASSPLHSLALATSLHLPLPTTGLHRMSSLSLCVFTKPSYTDTHHQIYSPPEYSMTISSLN